MDEGVINQNEPILARQTSVNIASYDIPLSIFEAESDEQIEEVFRRINSGGRKLSRQDLRTAGALGKFAEVVRRISIEVRGDVSSEVRLPLNDMKQISINSKGLSYGLAIEDIFWVKNGILTKDQIRESRDEEIVSDLIAYMISDNPPPSRSEYIDDYFSPRDNEASKTRYSDMENSILKYGDDNIVSDFILVLNDIRTLMEDAGLTFSEMIFGKFTERAPRYFQVLFLAFFQLLIKNNKKVSSYADLVGRLKGIGEKINIPEGGRWGAEDRHNEVVRQVAVLEKSFVDLEEGDPTRSRWLTQFEGILTASKTEQAAYDFKIGFIRLNGEDKCDEGSFDKVMETLVAMANNAPNKRGYVIIGVADKDADAARVLELYGVKAIEFANFKITGIDHEQGFVGGNLDKYLMTITNKIKQSGLSEPLKTYAQKNIRLISYYSKHIIVLTSSGQSEVSNFNGNYFVREGNKNSLVDPKSLATFIRAYG
ncbi:hypothetical protein [Mesorhizobium sp. M0488]|uniref:hypothetical protein n=1 Tax=unclassified Mesorhizobium TaxID=325217 RepID=UPI003339AC2A